jgi:hypothetical protein
LLGKLPFIHDLPSQSSDNVDRGGKHSLSRQSQRDSSSDEEEVEESPHRREIKVQEASTVCSEGAGVVGGQLRTIRFHINGGTVDTKMPSATTLFQIRQRVKRRFDGNYQVCGFFFFFFLFHFMTFVFSPQIFASRNGSRVAISSELIYTDFVRPLGENDVIELILIPREKDSEN